MLSGIAVPGEYQSRIRAVSGPYQGRIRAVYYMAVSEPYQGRIRAVSEECESHIKRVSGQYPFLSFFNLINFEFKTVASPILILVFSIFNSNFVF